ncbi:adenylate kinase [Winogradskyella sp. PG-2]|nr:adenylate kinase [Winogradskyella sp. PG-2]
MSKYEEKGDLVPDHIMKNLFANILDENSDKNGVILDGYPRTITQVDDLLELVNERSLKIGKVINIEVNQVELLKRAEKRAETSDRKDDKDKRIHLKRIRVFESETKPAISYMKTMLKIEDFNGLGTVEEITNKIKARIIN